MCGLPRKESGGRKPQEHQQELRKQGYLNRWWPMHFTPKVADQWLYAEKVHQSGNYLDAPRTFKQVDYTDEEYAVELQRYVNVWLSS